MKPETAQLVAGLHKQFLEFDKALRHAKNILGQDPLPPDQFAAWMILGRMADAAHEQETLLYAAARLVELKEPGKPEPVNEM